MLPQFVLLLCAAHNRRILAMLAAFFDLDGTLLTANSGALWIRRERRLGRISAWQVLEATFYLAAYRFGAVDIERVTVKALQTVKGEREETLRQWTHQWFQQQVAPHAAPGAWPVLHWHREQGHLLVLLTSASLYESEVATPFFSMDTFLCTRYEVKDGLLTGNVVLPICFGEGKVIHAERLAEERGLDLQASYFYTDSISDRPMLERVAHPRAVHPDPRLRHLARRRGWPMLSWRSDALS